MQDQPNPYEPPEGPGESPHEFNSPTVLARLLSSIGCAVLGVCLAFLWPAPFVIFGLVPPSKSPQSPAAIVGQSVALHSNGIAVIGLVVGAMWAGRKAVSITLVALAMLQATTFIICCRMQDGYRFVPVYALGTIIFAVAAYWVWPKTLARASRLQ